MKKTFLLIFFLCTVFLNATMPEAASAFSDGPLPTVIITRPPKSVVIPGTRYVYFLPDYDEVILFYHGFWYRPYSGDWFRSKGYNGPWKPVQKVPGQVLDIPDGFRSVGEGAEKIPYLSLKKHWREWERTGYWEEGARKERQKKKAARRPDKKQPKPAGKGADGPVEAPPPAREKGAPDNTTAGPQKQGADREGAGQVGPADASPSVDTTVKEPVEEPARPGDGAQPQP